MPTKRLHYARVGLLERHKGLRSFWWATGWAEVLPDGNTSQPWVTRLEACRDARADGCQAKFHQTIEQATAAQQPNMEK